MRTGGQALRSIARDQTGTARINGASPRQRTPRERSRPAAESRPPADDLLLAAEARALVPSGMERCVIVGGGFSGSGEEFGLMRVRTAPAERTELHAMPCSINPWGEVGMLRLPEREPEPDEPTFGWKKRLGDENADRRREYQDEIERRLRIRLEKTERKKIAESSKNMADMFNRLGNKWATIQDDKIAQRKQEVELAKYELRKHALRRKEQAVTKIAGWWRMILGRRLYRALLHAHRKKLAEQRWSKYMKKRRRQATLYIQSWWKGFLQRMRYKEWRRMKREDWLSGRLRGQKKLEVAICRAKVNDKFRKRCAAAKVHGVLLRLAAIRMKPFFEKRMVIYSFRAIVRIQAWYRGQKVRRELRRLSTEIHVGPDDLERLRRIRREAFHTSTTLAESDDMAMVTRTLKRREAEEHERLKRGLREARDVARAVEVGLWHEAEVEEVPLRELTDFLEAKRLKAEDDEASRKAEADVFSIRGGEATRAAARLEQELQDVEDDKRVVLGLSRVRSELKQIHRNMAELQDGTAVFSRLQDFKRTVDFRFC